MLKIGIAGLLKIAAKLNLASDGNTRQAV